MDFEFRRAEIEDVVFIRKKYFPDNRGSLIKEYEATPFLNFIHGCFKEEYISVSQLNVLRGLHFQTEPAPQGKLISIIKGQIFDVAVDLRRNSPTYLKYVSEYLSSYQNESVWIPAGFAHGFLSLSNESIVVNRCTNEFDPSLEGGIKWNDPKVGIKWPSSNPILSDKDDKWPPL